ncbi:MAG: 2Fe-2S iron-sulfur cluster-binding protein [Chromatiales bacterium]|jgi:CDP-4-dehydro-6-deoxyglucose reductase
MPNLLSLSRAARLAGVSRGELQKKIRQEDAKTFEGKVTIDVLLELYPHIDLEKDPVLERVQKIRAEAKPKKHYSDGWMPDPEVLMSRLKEFQHTLVQTKAALNASEIIMQETLTALNSARDASPEQLRREVADCISQLEKAQQRAERADDARAALFAKDAMLKIVTASVRLLPSGHEFFLEGNDSILDAGLKAGLYLDYGCTSGNCGSCKCKVVSGAVRKLRDHDYVISAREQEQGYILACSNTAISDLVIEAREAGMIEELPHQKIRAVVRKIERMHDELVLLNIQTPRTHSLRFKAGQQVKLTAENGTSTELCIASCPCDGRNLQFIVARKPDDPFSATVLSENMAKQTVMIEGPAGNFVLQEDSSTPAIFMAKGAGFAPIKSLVEQAITIDNAEGLQLIHVGGNPPGSSLDNLCRAWSDSLDNFVYSDLPANTGTAELIEVLSSALAGVVKADVYLAGPEDWLQTLIDAAYTKGLQPKDWHYWAIS